MAPLYNSTTKFQPSILLPINEITYVFVNVDGQNFIVPSYTCMSVLFKNDLGLNHEIWDAEIGIHETMQMSRSKNNNVGTRKNQLHTYMLF